MLIHSISERLPVSRIWIYVPCVVNGLGLVHLVNRVITLLCLLVILSLFVFAVEWKIKNIKTDEKLKPENLDLQNKKVN